MINAISIHNFQSLRKVELDLGTFTVIVGPSSSGKSALMRAFRALASNVRGSGVITRGQKAMAITARTDTHVVTLERTERSGTYKIADGSGSNLTFTKLAGDVPKHVTNALRIEPVGPSGSVNFANQFDKPYLLDESGATVAFVLGELTNVTRIFEAVRAANRIRTQASSTLKTRKSDLDQIKDRLAAFSGLRDRLDALEAAEQLNTRRIALEARIDRLRAALRTVRVAEQVIAKATVPEAPTADRLTAVNNRYLDLDAKLRGVAAKQGRLKDAVAELERRDSDVVYHEELVKDVLSHAGVCPTCGQQIP